MSAVSDKNSGSHQVLPVDIKSDPAYGMCDHRQTYHYVQIKGAYGRSYEEAQESMPKSAVQALSAVVSRGSLLTQEKRELTKMIVWSL